MRVALVVALLLSPGCLGLTQSPEPPPGLRDPPPMPGSMVWTRSQSEPNVILVASLEPLDDGWVLHVLLGNEGTKTVDVPDGGCSVFRSDLSGPRGRYERFGHPCLQYLHVHELAPGGWIYDYFEWDGTFRHVDATGVAWFEPAQEGIQQWRISAELGSVSGSGETLAGQVDFWLEHQPAANATN